MLFSQIKTASHLRAFIENNPNGSKFFSRENMRVAGDTMANFGIKRHPCGVVELVRKHKTPKGFTDPHFFRPSSCGTFAVKTAKPVV